MNTIKTSVLAIALALGSITYANNSFYSGTEPNSISKEISKLLDEQLEYFKSEFKAQVTFTVNKSHEIVVIDVDSDNEKFVNYIKSRLNYKKLKAEATSGKMYFLPVSVKKY